MVGDCAQVRKLCPKHTAMALAWEAVSKAARSNKLDEKQNIGKTRIQRLVVGQMPVISKSHHA